MMPASGINDDKLTSGINDEVTEENFNESSDEGEDSQGKPNENTPDKTDWRKKFYSTTNLQNRQISEMKKELDQIKNQKSLSDDDLAKIKDKYDEEDLDIIEKIIERKAGELMDKRQSMSLEQREMNIFLKEFPDLTDPEIKHIKSLQKEYWYSLKKAHSILFGKQEPQVPAKKSHSVWNSFQGDSSAPSKSEAKAREDEKAWKDMDAFL